jgi:hypothetical protein
MAELMAVHSAETMVAMMVARTVHRWVEQTASTTAALMAARSAAKKDYQMAAHWDWRTAERKGTAWVDDWVRRLAARTDFQKAARLAPGKAARLASTTAAR